MENTYFRALKKIVLIHRTLLAKNVIFLEIALVFSENKKKYSKMGKNYQTWLRFDWESIYWWKLSYIMVKEVSQA